MPNPTITSAVNQPTGPTICAQAASPIERRQRRQRQAGDDHGRGVGEPLELLALDAARRRSRTISAAPAPMVGHRGRDEADLSTADRSGPRAVDPERVRRPEARSPSVPGARPSADHPEERPARAQPGDPAPESGRPSGNTSGNAIATSPGSHRFQANVLSQPGELEGEQRIAVRRGSPCSRWSAPPSSEHDRDHADDPGRRRCSAGARSGRRASDGVADARRQPVISCSGAQRPSTIARTTSRPARATVPQNSDRSVPSRCGDSLRGWAGWQAGHDRASSPGPSRNRYGGRRAARPGDLAAWPAAGSPGRRAGGVRHAQGDGAARAPRAGRPPALTRGAVRAAVARPGSRARARGAAADAVRRCASRSARSGSTPPATASRCAATDGLEVDVRRVPGARGRRRRRSRETPSRSSAASCSRASTCATARASTRGTCARRTRCSASSARRSARLVRALTERGEYGRAIRHAQRWLALDPLHEPAHRELIRLYALDGDRAAALAQYRDCVRTLSQELGVPPVDETAALFEQVSEGTLVAPRPGAGARPAAPARRAAERAAARRPLRPARRAARRARAAPGPTAAWP